MCIPVRFAALLLHCALAFFRSHREQAIVDLALRQQFAAYAQKRPRPKLSPLDRAFWVVLSRLWPRRKNSLVIVRPETVVRWHRQGYMPGAKHPDQRLPRPRSGHQRSRMNIENRHQCAIVGGPVLDPVLRLVLGMDSRLHAEIVAHRAPTGPEPLIASSLRFMHQRRLTLTRFGELSRAGPIRALLSWPGDSLFWADA